MRFEPLHYFSTGVLIMKDWCLLGIMRFEVNIRSDTLLFVYRSLYHFLLKGANSSSRSLCPQTACGQCLNPQLLSEVLMPTVKCHLGPMNGELLYVGSC